MLIKMDCTFCNRNGTKYICVRCGNPVCNVCAEAVHENEEGYDEPNYRVGKCPGNTCKIMDVNNEMINSLNVDGVNNGVYRDDSDSRDVNSDTVIAVVEDETLMTNSKKRTVGIKKGKPVDIFNFFNKASSADSHALEKRKATKNNIAGHTRAGQGKIDPPPGKKKFELKNYPAKNISKQI